MNDRIPGISVAKETTSRIFYGFVIAIAAFFVSMTARWFNTRRNLMTGLVSSGAGAGMLVIPPCTAFLINRYGWKKAGQDIWHDHAGESFAGTGIR